ncbi:asparagine--tRNA ligase [Leptospira gomenensis]|uniref:Asparagine--tRNA ligase n=1 Tax=Leptospira gomenensis TaxID=2484974 RepID=A0A5F1YEJ0_9LEPT|nr:asparagine--tRNA ligase [Leptospira gomenensis]TGK37482.1 asparagine--tRNA ligase [Leptospira gomenensis]TGK39512.1 asparagine--tRNA ligase [Leptospira gomenensis]TGK43067.1 asparagine--tRNA ligase [Leptospira gomenensis]TGK54331.1 asparagine--tRNA ligase [Leptospira gomenensis]
MSETPVVSIHEVEKHVDQNVTIQGWVHGIRGSNARQFVSLRTGGRILQVLAEKEILGEEVFQTVKHLRQETSVAVTGKLVRNEKSPIGFELVLESIRVVGESENYPITPKEHGIDFLISQRHLWLRSSKQLAILRVRDHLSFAIRKYFHERNFLLIDTPILTGSVGESAGTLFSTPYFDLGNAYLAQTGQLYLETAIFAHTKVFCYGPTFRAEKSKTRRHLTEFWMVEAEVAFSGHKENLELQEDFVKTVIRETVQRSLQDLKVLERDPTPLLAYLDKKFPVIDYSEALEILQKKGEDIVWGDDINSEREQMLTTEYGGPIFIQKYPREAKAFYMKVNPENPKTVLNADLIAPDGVGEIIGGSEREENYETIVERLREEKLPVESYDWYLDLRKYGSVPHSGFGLGSERLIAWICGLAHVRECIPFPRMMERLYP